MKKRVLLGVSTLWVGEWQGQVLADCGFGFEAQFMNEELKKKIMGNDRAVCRLELEATELK